MNNTKSPKNVSLKNQLELWLFCALIGAVAGALVWILLKIMAVGTEFLWKWITHPSTRSFIRFKDFRSVDLPQPLGPIKAVISFSGIAMFIFLSA